MTHQTPSGPRPPHYGDFTITIRHTTLVRTPLDEGSARNRGLCMTTHNTPNIQTFMLMAGIEPAIPASKQPQLHALDRCATGIGNIVKYYQCIFIIHVFKYIPVVCFINT
jgi:hypothetical protein